MASPDGANQQLVVFRLGEGLQALPLAAVERVIPAVEITALPGLPAGLLGAIDVAGRVVPVFDLRERLALPPRAVHPDQQFLLARAGTRLVALVADEVRGVDEVAVPAPAVRVTGLQGVARLPDGLLLIHDLDRLLTPLEERALVDALDAA